jgi:hypothetical protein
VAVPLPWCGTLKKSTRCPSPMPPASSDGSTSSSTSPVSRNRRCPKCTSKTSEESLIALPTDGAFCGSEPRGGHSTAMVMPSSVTSSPAASTDDRRPARPSSRRYAASPGPLPSIPFSATVPTAYRSSSSARPATWSSCGWVSTTRSMRRSHAGMRWSSWARRRSGSGPESSSIRPPRGPSSRIASPCPTSRTLIRRRPSGRAAATTSVTTRTAPAAPTPTAMTRRLIGRGAPAAAGLGRVRSFAGAG